jgi:glycosyltransferase involved in cell wall biosynthesis
MNDDITVVIPCFNYGAFLGEALDSVLSQEGGPPRVIVVDDGSTDPATLHAYEHLPPGVVLTQQPNAGLADTRNRGLREADTPYLLALDADDRLPPGALRVLRRQLDDDPALGFSYGLIEFFGDWQGLMRMPPYDPYKLIYRHIIGPTALFRRELFEDVGGYHQFGGYEDWEFWVHALAHGWRGRRVEAVTWLYRRHGETMYAGARERYRHWYRLLRERHGQLYTRASRARLAAESSLGPAGRLVYRWWWGARPLPARVEIALQSLLWRAK